ncbi:NUDIX domain-containing protein [Haloarchaeobius sp. TZWWS8]|uniref:NUDIX domain-containing protein n=1 Tax=Haloarchaeobius sp. TZWWS8 TaxID=3446121 RepID=UPI003EBC85D8
MTTYPASFCPDCGSELTERRFDGRERRFCDSCEQIVWHNPVPCAGVAVVSDDGVLLTQRDVEPGIGEWAVPGGHMEVEESPEAAAARELEEETGVRVDPAALALLDTFAETPFPGKTVVSIGFAVRAEETSGEPVAGNEVQQVGRFTPDSFAASGETMHVNHDRRFEAAWELLG